MKEFLQNAWVVGIGGGIISGIIVFFVTKYIADRKDNSGYLKTIDLANKEVINMLKPYISDKGLPDVNILNSILSATSRKYKIKVNEMQSISTICEELICEIISNIYVSNDKKEEYMNELEGYKSKLSANNKKSDKEELYIQMRAESEYRRRLNKQYSFIVSLAVALIVSVSMVFLMYDKDMIIFNINEFRGGRFELLYLLIMIACILPLMSLNIIRDKLKNNIKNDVKYKDTIKTINKEDRKEKSDNE